MSRSRRFESQEVNRNHDPHGSELDVAELMHVIRSEVFRKRDINKAERFSEQVIGGRGESMSHNIPVDTIALPRLPETCGDLPVKDSYHLSDFLEFHEVEFLRNAYRALLHREPDAQGSGAFLEQLRTGHRTRIEVLGRLRYSSEGRVARVPVHGLLAPFAMHTARRMPIIGRLLGVGQYLLKLPDIVGNHERLEGFVIRGQLASNRRINAIASQIEDGIERIRRTMVTPEDLKQPSSRLETVESKIQELVEQHDKLLEASARFASRNDLRERMASIVKALESKADQEQLTFLANHFTDLVGQRAAKSALDGHVQWAHQEVRELRDLTAEVASRKGDKADLTALDERLAHQEYLVAAAENLDRDLRRRLDIVIEDLAKTSAPGDHAAITLARDNDAFDSFYAALENRFRGSREEIRERAAIYLAIVREAGAGTALAPVVDLGCGRGEWLELLRDSGLVGRGIDLNRATVRQCQASGLDVIHGEAVAYLGLLASGSLGAVTGIHVIEHLSFNGVLALLDESLRVLRQGGVAIFETPNPENVVVGACNFHTDPTHVRPLPPALMQFVLEARGFSRVAVRRLGDLTAGLPTGFAERDANHVLNPFLHALRHNFFSPPDYAVIAVKGRSSIAIPD